MKWPAICVTVAALTPATVVITLVVMLGTDRMFSREPNKFPCLFCAIEDDVGDEYRPTVGQGIPNPPYYYMPPDPSIQWSSDGAHLMFADQITVGHGYPSHRLQKTYILAMDDLTAQPSDSPSPRLSTALPSAKALPDVPTRNGEHDHALAPRVSPDGSRLVYASYRHLTRDDDAWNNYERTFEIETVNIDRSRPTRLTHDLDWNVMPTWSPDGSRIAFVKYGYLPLRAECVEDTRGLYLMNADGSDVRMIAPFTFPQRVLHTPAWSPDGHSLAYVLAEHKCGDYLYGNEDEKTALYRVGADGSGLQLLVRMEGIRSPSWSPDGERIAFGVAGGDSQGAYTIRPDGTDLRQVHDRSVNQVVWSPDGSELLINGGYVVRSDGIGKGHLIAPLYEHNRTYWGEGSAYGHGWGAWSPDGSRIAVYRPQKTSLPYMPAVLFTVAPDGSDVRVLAVEGESTASWHRCWPVDTGAPACTPEGSSLYEYGPRLMEDYEMLLAVRDTLAGDAMLNWSPSQPITAWHGVLVASTGRETLVRGLHLDVSEDALTGCIPRALEELWGAASGLERCASEGTERPRE